MVERSNWSCKNPSMRKMSFSFNFLFSCSSLYRGKEVCGADQFVMDSYEIKKGKFFILEMEGQMVSPLPKHLLKEYPDQITEGDILSVFVFHPKRKDLTQTLQAVS